MSVLESCMKHSSHLFLGMVETMLRKDKERSRIRVLQRDTLRGLLGIRRMVRVPNARIRELCGVTKWVDERIEKGVLGWFDHVERMESDRTAKRIYVRECTGSRSLRSLRKRWIVIVKECLRKRSMHIRQERRMMPDRCEWRCFVRRNAWGVDRGMNIDEMLQLWVPTAI